MNALEILKQFGSEITITDVIILLPGVTLLGIWLLKTSFGRKALADSVPRRNNMPAYLPFVPLFIWFGIVSLAITIAANLLPDLPDWQGAFLDNAFLSISAIATMAVIIFLAKAHFARRLKGFGLNAKTIHKDFLAAFLNLLSVWPIVMLMIILTTFLGKLIWGQEFEMQQHQELELITAYSELPVRVLIIITAVAVVPVFEEMLFRGLFQTMIRSLLDARCSILDARKGAWLSIIISSGLFTAAHYEPTHWPALFALSVCMGYAYEKSGSLFRPIFIHSLFNAISIIAALYSG
jgi:membrane protease YdiL (CAAX protease family)